MCCNLPVTCILLVRIVVSLVKDVVIYSEQTSVLSVTDIRDMYYTIHKNSNHYDTMVG